MSRINRNPVAIEVRNVTQRFRLIQERPDTVRELFARIHRRKVHYHEFNAVKNVSLQVHKGEIVGIIGRNGSGKSTLLKMVAGVYAPSAGTIEVIGTMAPLIELGAGFHPELTGRENIILNGLLLGFSKRQMLAREASILEFADIGDFIDSPVKQYSSGMYMRLAFAVATEVDPDVLVVDEILAVGDTAFQKKCFERIERFRDVGKTILFVTHSMTQITEFCDRAVLLEQGQVLREGSPDQVVDTYLEASAAQSKELVDVAHH